MNNPNQRNSTMFDDNRHSKNDLWQYVQALSPDTIEQMSKPNSPEVFQLMEQNIMGLLGHLPSEHFAVSISTSREHLGRLLASAMMSGYFIRNAEQRMNFENTLCQMDASSKNPVNEEINEQNDFLSN
jgi:hypothetical protein